MKQNKFLLRILPLLLGIVGLALYMLLLATGRDERRLLIPWHWAGVVLCILSLIVLAGLPFLTGSLEKMRYSTMFPASVFGAVGCWLAGVGLGYTAVREVISAGDILALVAGIFGILAAICMILTGFSRLKGKIPSYLLYAVLAVYFMLHLVSQYRSWSAEPQLLRYLFSLLASVCLVFTAYLSASLAGGQNARRWFVVCNRAALFFCCVSLAGEMPLFYLSMAIWTGTGLCSTAPTKTNPQEE